MADPSRDDLLRRGVKAARSSRFPKRYKHPRWVAVMDLFAIGSSKARELCVWAGLDPDEQVTARSDNA